MSQPSSGQRQVLVNCNGYTFYNEFKCLVGETSPFQKVLLLGGFSKKVVLNPGTKSLTIYRRVFWIKVEPRHIEFDEVTAILFDDKIHQVSDYSNFYSRYSAEFLSYIRVTWERISVLLALKDGSHALLFTLTGAAKTEDNVFSLFFGDLQLPQQSVVAQDRSNSVAKNYAQALSNVIGAPISKSLNI